MHRIALILVALFLGLHPTAATNAAGNHDFHYSRFALEWNASTETWQGILRVFTDDLENVLNQVADTDTAWRLGDEREAAEADEHIAAYTSSHWSMLDENGERLKWTFVGKEVDFDITYIYLESAPVRVEAVRKVESHGFAELFDDQVNEISIAHSGHSLRLWLNEEDPVKPIEIQSHD